MSIDRFWILAQFVVGVVAIGLITTPFVTKDAMAREKDEGWDSMIPPFISYQIN